ncbi:hypothetical protein NA57DRAFT_74279 [Rhizodiscina lignyota]|uniref:Uncharacterized protein n=1 Tax=Rhizodiscina lignyota TaxID=1504668 RepID=A0A9P4IM69_9PEZI|nr:hypothetical protein NA57DRAFT_74279 [Rhizodiscina lignyota]
MFGPHLVGTSAIVVGRVLGIHVMLHGAWDLVLTDMLQLFDVLKAAPIARHGYHQYTHIDQVWDMHMPIMPDDTASGGVLGGNMQYDIGEDEGKGERQIVGSVPVSEPVKPDLKRVISRGKAFAQ